jgi:hypothetical protein
MKILPRRDELRSKVAILWDGGDQADRRQTISVIRKKLFEENTIGNSIKLTPPVRITFQQRYAP